MNETVKPVLVILTFLFLSLGLVGLVETNFVGGLVRSVSMMGATAESFQHGPQGGRGGHGNWKDTVTGAEAPGTLQADPGNPAAPVSGRPQGHGPEVTPEAWVKVGWYAAIMALAGTLTALVAMAIRRFRRLGKR